MLESKCYYVYEHIRLDNMTCFYVGKGKDNRKDRLIRNAHHDNITNKHEYAVVIIAENLTEKEAHVLEISIIDDYVFNIGYNINIKGYTCKGSNECLTNQTWGGEGSSGKIVTEKTKVVLREKAKLQWQRLSDEDYKKYSDKMRAIALNRTQEETDAIYNKIPKLIGSLNPHARAVVCYTLEYVERFGSISEAEQKFGILQSNISQSIANKINHSGYLKDILPLVWSYEEDYNNFSKEEKGVKIRKAIMSAKVIYCITTKNVFKNVPDAINKCNISKYAHINDCCRGKTEFAGKLVDNTPLQWCYYIDYLNLKA